ncbi:MAG: hypothetical protein IPN20_12520 [Haliscomenobacter sp.]|nr:hypothetical protein [Haliscomenobacter sp.]
MKQPPFSSLSKSLQRLSELQGHRVAELEREIRLYAPELARKLGLE